MHIPENIFQTVEPHEAPALHQAIEELCAKAGIAKPKIQFVQHTEQLGALEKMIFEHVAAASSHPEPTVVFGHKFREMMGQSHPAGPVSEEFKAIIAHELGHLKHRDSTVTKAILREGAPLIGLVAGLAGTWYAVHLKAQAAKAVEAGATPEQAQQDIHQVWQESGQIHPSVPQHYHKDIHAGRIIAGGLLGFGVGTAVNAIWHRHIEFRADQFSAMLMNDGKPLARGLKQCRAQMNEAIKAIEPSEIGKYLAKNPYATWLSMFSHPKDAERLARLEAWTPAR